MSLPWFFHPEIGATGSIVNLSADEAQHARGSRRLAVGEDVCLFDGRGLIARATIDSLGGKRQSMTILVQALEQQPPIEPNLTIASAVPKGDRLATLLSMLAQLGVHTFVPLVCRRSVAEGGRGLGERGQRIIIEACKQANCAHAMQIAPPQSVLDVAASTAGAHGLVLVAHPTGRPLVTVENVASTPLVTVLIGPEGGFTDGELQQSVSSGAIAVSLGSTTLRVETAAVASASAVRLVADRA